MIRFAKGHGLGNDYVVIDQTDLSAPLTPTMIRRLCDRNRGIGSDGILLRVPASRADFGLRIFNPEGSEAEKSATASGSSRSTSGTTGTRKRQPSRWRRRAASSSVSA